MSSIADVPEWMRLSDHPDRPLFKANVSSDDTKNGGYNFNFCVFDTDSAVYYRMSKRTFEKRYPGVTPVPGEKMVRDNLVLWQVVGAPPTFDNMYQMVNTAGEVVFTGTSHDVSTRMGWSLGNNHATRVARARKAGLEIVVIPSKQKVIICTKEEYEQHKTNYFREMIKRGVFKFMII